MKQKSSTNGGGACLPPSLQFVKIYFEQKGLPAKTAEGFFDTTRQETGKPRKALPFEIGKRPQTIGYSYISNQESLNSLM